MVPFSAPLLVKKSSDLITISDQTSLYVGLDPEDSYASYRLGADGKIYAGGAPSLTFPYLADWIAPLANAGNYQCRAVLSSGTFTSGTDNVWEALTANRSWHVQQLSVGAKTAVFTLEIREAVSLIVRDTAIITLTAQVEA